MTDDENGEHHYEDYDETHNDIHNDIMTDHDIVLEILEKLYGDFFFKKCIIQNGIYSGEDRGQLINEPHGVSDHWRMIGKTDWIVKKLENGCQYGTLPIQLVQMNKFFKIDGDLLSFIHNDPDTFRDTFIEELGEENFDKISDALNKKFLIDLR